MPTKPIYEWNDEIIKDAIKALDKPFNSRNQIENELLMKLTENIKFFQEIGNIDQMAQDECCQYLYYCKKIKDDILLHPDASLCEKFILYSKQMILPIATTKFNINDLNLLDSFQNPKFLLFLGSTGKTFYFILEGSLNVYRQDKPKIEGSKRQLQTKDAFDINSQSIFHESNERIEVLKSGDFFSDIAIREKGQKLITIQARELTHLACLDKEKYDKILLRIEERKREADLNFYKKIPFLKNFSDILLQKLHMQMVPFKVMLNQSVYNEGDEAKDIYFVKSGELKLTKTVELEEEKLDDPRDIFPINDPSGLKVIPTKKIIIDLAIFNQGHICGEDDLEFERKRFANVKCLSAEAEILKISADEFSRRITLLDEYARNFIKNQIKDKEILYKQRINQVLETRSKHKNYLMQTINHGKKDILQLSLSSSPSNILNSSIKSNKLTVKSPDNSYIKSPKNNPNMGKCKTHRYTASDPRGYLFSSLNKKKIDTLIIKEKHNYDHLRINVESEFHKSNDSNQNSFLKLNQISPTLSRKNSRTNISSYTPKPSFLPIQKVGMHFQKQEYIEKEEKLYKKMDMNEEDNPVNNLDSLKKLRVIYSLITKKNIITKKRMQNAKNIKDNVSPRSRIVESSKKNHNEIIQKPIDNENIMNKIGSIIHPCINTKFLSTQMSYSPVYSPKTPTIDKEIQMFPYEKDINCHTTRIKNGINQNLDTKEINMKELLLLNDNLIMPRSPCHRNSFLDVPITPSNKIIPNTQRPITVEISKNLNLNFTSKFEKKSTSIPFYLSPNNLKQTYYNNTILKTDHNEYNKDNIPSRKALKIKTMVIQELDKIKEHNLQLNPSKIHSHLRIASSGSKFLLQPDAMFTLNSLSKAKTSRTRTELDYELPN